MERADIRIDRNTALLANSVHEIRTPIQTVISTLELLSDTHLNEEQTEYIRQIKFSSDILLSLVNDILDFSKIQSSEFQLESIAFDVIALTGQSADFLCIEAFDKKLEIVTDVDYTIPRYFMGDPTRVQEILINLVKNAVKFTPKGYVHVGLKKEIRKSDKKEILLFEVTDSGIGIAEEKREKLFTDFYQADSSTTRKYGGTGLGLAISKKLVTAMDGEIGVRSNEGGGSVFWFTLPLVPATEQEIAQIQQKPDINSEEEFPIDAKTKILVVDDNILALRSMKNKLNSLNLLNVELAQNAKQALAMLLHAEATGSPFKIIFIDMIMPRVDGWHLAADINEHPELNSLKRYLLVPEGQMGGEAKMKLMKWFTGYLYKPIKRKKLRTILCETYDIPTDVEPLEEEMKKAAAANEKIAQGIPILVAEDHSVNRRLIVQSLEKFGAIPYTASDGQEAIEQIDEHPEIAIVFMDIQMPVLDGISSTKQLRAKNYGGIIIACTANNNKDEFIEYTNAGINDILIKPFKRDEIKFILEKWKNTINIPEIKIPEQSRQHIEQHKSLAQTEKSISGDSHFWDESEFENTIDYNYKFGITLLDEYCRQTKNLLNGAAVAIYEKDFTELRRVGHTIAGSSGAISAFVLAENGKFFNEQAKTQDRNNIKKAYIITRKNFLKFEHIAQKWKARHE